MEGCHQLFSHPSYVNEGESRRGVGGWRERRSGGLKLCTSPQSPPHSSSDGGGAVAVTGRSPAGSLWGAV